MNLLLALPFAAAVLHQPARDDPLTDAAEAEVRALLDVDDSPDFKRLAQLGGLDRPALPVYARIIKDDRENKLVVASALRILTHMGEKVDPGRFLEPTIARLTDPDQHVRLSAVRLLRYIGGPKDTTPVVAFLWDERSEMVYITAETLAKIGDRRAVTALDIWLGPGNPYGDSTLPAKVRMRKHVAKCRDELVARLKEDEAKKDTKPPAK